VYQRHNPPQEIGAMGHPAFVAGEASWSSLNSPMRVDCNKVTAGRDDKTNLDKCGSNAYQILSISWVLLLVSPANANV